MFFILIKRLFQFGILLATLNIYGFENFQSGDTTFVFTFMNILFENIHIKEQLFIMSWYFDCGTSFYSEQSSVKNSSPKKFSIGFVFYLEVH